MQMQAELDSSKGTKGKFCTLVIQWRPCWCRLPLKTPTGERLWYSPVLRRVALTMESAPWGGFLAEEMVSHLLAMLACAVGHDAIAACSILAALCPANVLYLDSVKSCMAWNR